MSIRRSRPLNVTALETERLRLRMFRQEDLDAYASICADPDVMRYLGDGKTLTRGEAWRQMALIAGHWHLRGFGLWAVEERATGALIGRIGFFEPDGWPGFELGWMLRRASWGQGYATEGARRALAAHDRTAHRRACRRYAAPASRAD